VVGGLTLINRSRADSVTAC